MDLPDLPAGIYRHYKNRLYFAFGYGHDANIDGRAVVQYVGLELEGAHTGPRLASRTAVSDDPDVDAWWDFVHADGSKCVLHHGNGVCAERRPTKPRFEYIGPSWEG
jgi:hypothetical protein